MSKTVLITGCSSGIGLALAKKVAQLDYRAIITAREGSLNRISASALIENDRLIIRALDVTDSKQCEQVISEANQRFGGVDILINNAGFATRATIEDMDDSSFQEQLETNFIGPMRLIRLVLPHMRQQRAGRIINLSSVGGMMAMPTMGAYSASKFALEGASEALWYELRPWGVKVTLIAPGFIHSESFRNTRLTRGAKTLEGNPYRRYYQAMGPFIERFMCLARSTPDSIADLILHTTNRADPPLRIPATLDAQMFFWIRRILPRALYHRLLYFSLPELKSWVPSDDQTSRR